MRVLHVSSGNLYGGVETALVALARFRHACPAMEQQFALSFEGRLSCELNEAGAVVHQLGAVRTSRPWTVLAARARLRKLLQRERFDAGICHMSWPMAVFGSTLKATVPQLAFWAHGPASGRGWLERWAGQVSPDLVIANSLYTKSSMPALFPATPCRVLYCPVLLPSLEDARQCRPSTRRDLGASDDTVVIIQVSRMESWKGHNLQLQALAAIKEDPRWVCWMVGGAQRPEEQEYLSSLQRTAAELGIDERVKFLGQRSDVQRLLAAADLFSQPNLGPEPFGIVFIEALWAGLPVIATAMGGPMEIINESCGILVPPGDPVQLAASLRLLIGSAELRARLGNRGHERALELSDPNQRIPNLYELLRRGAPDRHPQMTTANGPA